MNFCCRLYYHTKSIQEAYHETSQKCSFNFNWFSYYRDWRIHFKSGGLGVDPFTAMNIGLSSMFGMQLGIFQIIVNAFILFYVYLKQKAIGLGTILNMLLVGILIQQISTWLQPYANSLGGSTIGKLLSLFVGVLIFTFALCIATDQGESL